MNLLSNYGLTKRPVSANPQVRQKTTSPAKDNIARQNTTIPIYFSGGRNKEIGEVLKATSLYAGEKINLFSGLRTRALELSEEILKNAGVVKRLTKEELLEESIKIGESVKTKDGALALMTGKYTGRTPEAKFFVETENAKKLIDWSSENQGITKESTAKIYEDLKNSMKGKPLYVHDAKIGADPQTALPVRVISTSPAQSFFSKNMFIDLTKAEKENFQPKLTIIANPELKLNPQKHGVKCEAGVIINPDDGVIMVAGTQYSGEIKKSAFTTMNYLVPQKGILPMHCSANVGEKGDVALFYGLSGTGKTTLSSAPNRKLIGDDEHMWTKKGIANIEGGCYAKTIGLSEKNEPEIWSAVNRGGAMLENVHIDKHGNPLFELDLKDQRVKEALMDPAFVNKLTLPQNYSDALKNGKLEMILKDESATKGLQAALKENDIENSRGSYPLSYVQNAVIPSHVDAHPKNIVFLAYDAYGVMPPVAKLTPEQAKYYFVSGYTSKVAGTERGVKEPKATFSTCFGGPFMPLHPFKYADMLADKIKQHNSDIYIVNTGLVGGKYGTGTRMNLKDTRSVVDAILDGKLKDVEYIKHPVFGFDIPKTCPGVNSKILNPAENWADQKAYEQTTKELANAFVENFNKKYAFNPDAKEMAKFGPQV